MKNLIRRYRHAWVLLYFPLYMIWFLWLEKHVTDNYTPVHMWLDDIIPFNEWFVIPYYMWFAYVFLVVAYLFFKDTKEFYRSVAFLFIGMTICLIIYTIWPNGQNLRPDLSTINRDNFALDIMRYLYSTDTCTNVCPSIHAFNSIGVFIAILHTDSLKNKKIFTGACGILTVSICLATVFLKQHSAFDVICAVVLSVVMYLAVYVPDYKRIFSKSGNKDTIISQT